jgi:hypothetical protein
MSNRYRGPSKDASYEININCVVISNEGFYLKFSYLVRIRHKMCPPQAILVSDWLIS